MNVLEKLISGFTSRRDRAIKGFADLALSVADNKNISEEKAAAILSDAGKNPDELAAAVKQIFEVRELKRLAETAAGFEARRKVIVDRMAARKAEYEKHIEALNAAEAADREEDSALAKAEQRAVEARNTLRAAEHLPDHDPRRLALVEAREAHAIAFSNRRKLTADRERQRTDEESFRRRAADTDQADRAGARAAEIEAMIPAADQKLAEAAAEVERCEIAAASA
jgi:hypothetical protein